MKRNYNPRDISQVAANGSIDNIKREKITNVIATNLSSREIFYNCGKKHTKNKTRVCHAILNVDSLKKRGLHERIWSHKMVSQKDSSASGDNFKTTRYKDTKNNLNFMRLKANNETDSYCVGKQVMRSILYLMED